MTTEIWRDFDPNLDIPEGLINVKVVSRPDVIIEVGEPDADIDIQDDTLNDDDSLLDEDSDDEELAVPGTYVIVSQTVRTAPDGTQVVDVVIDVEEVDGAEKYEVRITK
jgi:hypothetical protein